MSQPETVPTVESTVQSRESIEVGDVVVMKKRVTEDDVQDIARATGDRNRLHLEEEYASQTRFGERIAHGVLGLGLLSGAMARVPGCPIIPVWKRSEFTAPIAIGETYEAEARIAEQKAGNHYLVDLELRDMNGQTVIESQSEVLVDPEPDVDVDPESVKRQ